MLRHIYWTKKVYLLKSIFFLSYWHFRTVLFMTKDKQNQNQNVIFQWLDVLLSIWSILHCSWEWRFFFFFNFDLVWSIAATNVFSSSFSVPNEHIITNVCILLPIVVHIYLFSSLEFASSSVFLQWACSQTVKPNVIMWRQFKGKKNWLFQLQGRSEIAANEL